MTPTPPPSDANATDLDGSLQRALRAVAISGVSLTLPGGAIWGGHVALGVGLGAAVAVANLFVVARSVQALMGSGTHAGWAVVGLVKMLGLFGGFWWLLRSGVVEALPFVVGYGALPLGITLAQVLTPAARGEGPGASPGPGETEPHAPADPNETSS